MIRSRVESGLRVLVFDRPERRNALTPAGLDALEAALAAATEPVVYLTGAGSAFCAGADLSVVDSLEREEAAAFARQGQRVARALAGYDGAVVAGIDGPARGGGVELALACDLRVGTPAASFAESGVEHGLFGAWGGTVRLPRIVGEGVAMDLSLSGRVLDADEAQRVGLLSRIVEEPRAVATALLDSDHRAIRTIKHRLRDTAPAEEQTEQEAAAFAALVEKRG
ncbi:MAG: enoyl-CoA hydratase/carnithine racemase [halophilic archaeon J07HX64]|jgi:Enoyl-CoA hydratase/carnithine racemase|nr:MAG: enoyl-CoA hydratase/carnithine racemase [halophilic archaeon J07HX64]